MPGEEFPIKNKASVLTCYAKYWRCYDYNCPVFSHCNDGLLSQMSDYHIKLQFKLFRRGK